MLANTPLNYMAALNASAHDAPTDEPEAKKPAAAGTRVQADLSALAVRTPLAEPNFEWSESCGVLLRYRESDGKRGWWIRERPGFQCNGWTIYDKKVWDQILKWAGEGKIAMHFAPKRGPQPKPKKAGES